MKFTIETGILNAALGVASVAVDRRMSLPVLGNIKIEARGKDVTLTTTNLDLFIEQAISAQVNKEGAITVPFDLLRRLTNRLTSTQTEMELTGKEVRIRSGEGNFILGTLPEDEFPPLPQKNGEAVTCDANELLKPLEKVFHAVSEDASRYNLNGVNFNGGEFVASDGRRIAIYSGREFTKESVIVPSMFIEAILGISLSGEIQTQIGDGIISVTAPLVKLVCKLIEAPFPNWKQSVPDKPGKEVFGCDRKELIEALKTCAIFKDGMTAALQITGRGKEIEVSKDENAKVLVLGCELAGQPKLTKRFNSDFLLESLAVLEEKNVAIHCDKDTPTLFIQEGPLKMVIQGMVAQ